MCFLITTIGYTQDKVVNVSTNKKGKKITLVRAVDNNSTAKIAINEERVVKTAVVGKQINAGTTKTNNTKKKLIIASNVKDVKSSENEEEEETESKSDIIKREKLETKNNPVKTKKNN